MIAGVGQAPLTPPPTPEADRTALFLDIDGTLLEHRAHPESVEVDQALRELLVLAFERFGGAVAFITGRMIEHVDRLFSPLRLPTAGIFGQEIRLTQSGEIEKRSQSKALRGLADELERRFGHVEGIHIERKDPVLAIHTRAAPHALEAINLAVEEALEEITEGHHIMLGNAGIEVLPVGALKSVAIERFMKVEPFARRMPVFIGDDISDESGFRFVNAIGGVSVRVFPKGETDANYVLKDVAATRRWLAALIS